MKTIELMKRMYVVYKREVAILLPLIILTSSGLFLDKIPYVNLFKEYVLTGILIIDWAVFLFVSRVRTETMFKMGFYIFALTFPLHFLRFDWYVETLANLCYIIFATALISEVLRLRTSGQEV